MQHPTRALLPLLLLSALLIHCATPPDPEPAERPGISPALKEMLEKATTTDPSSEGTDAPPPTTGLPGPTDKTPRVGNTTIRDFGKAKYKAKAIFAEMKGSTTFYCGCKYTFGHGSGGTVDWDSCGFRPRKNAKRAKRTEWEHVVPASAFGHSFSEWKQGHPDCHNKRGPFKGRRCVGQVNQEFSFMEADLYNLRPAVGEVNGDRSSKIVGEVVGEERKYGDCDVEISKDTVEPRPEVRGNVARTYLYMDWAYPNRNIIPTEGMRIMLRDWATSDPVDKEEFMWAKAVEAVQGNPNPFVAEAMEIGATNAPTSPR